MQDGSVQSESATDVQKPMYLGMFASRNASANISALEAGGLVLAALWLFAWLIYLAFGTAGANVDTAQLRLGVMLLVAIVPAMLLGLFVYVARSVRLLEDQAERFHMALSAVRQGIVGQRQSGILDQSTALDRKLDEIAAAQRSTDAKLARFQALSPDLERESTQIRAALGNPADGPAKEASDGSQPSLELGTPIDAVTHPLSVADFIKALNFPDNPEDKEGFRALRRALQDRNSNQLVTAAQDLLTLLSQDGIYMDDLKPDRARPEIWRRFAKGERGKSIAILGGIRDRSSLALCAGRMRQDTIFRDSVHHFLRKFDHTFSEFEKSASDLDIIALTDTRSARAFMLLGRVTGTFD